MICLIMRGTRVSTRQRAQPNGKTLVRSLADDYVDPLIWNRRNRKLIGGRFRKKVMRADGWTHADVVVKDYDEVTHLARMRALNAHSGDWNQDLLKSIAIDLDGADFDPALAMWDAKELALLLEPPEIASDDDQAEALLSEADKLQDKWNVKPGDLYQIGPHRLLCATAPSSRIGACFSMARKPTWCGLIRPTTSRMVTLEERRNEAKAAWR